MALIVMYAILILDFIGFSFFISCLPILFSNSFGSLFEGVSHNVQYLLLGAFLGTFSLAQAIGNYGLSKVINRHSVRFFFVLSYIGYTVGYFLCGVAVSSSLPWLLFIGNAVSGLLAFNLGTIQAEICSIAKGAKRLKYFGIMGVCIGFAFFCGSSLFSYCCEQIKAGILSLNQIFFLCSGLSAVCLIVLYQFAPHMRVSLPQEFSFENVRFDPPKRLFAIGAFLFALGWNIFLKFSQIYLLNERHFDEIIVARVLAYFGIGTFLAQLLIVFNHYIIRFNRLIYALLPLFSTLLFAFVFVDGQWSLFGLMTLLSFLYGYIQANIPLIGSQLSDESHSSMPLYQSSQALARFLAPIAGGVYMYFSSQSPFMMGGLFLILSIAFFHRLRPFISSEEIA